MKEVMSEEEWKERSALSGIAYLARSLGNLEKLDGAMKIDHLTPKGDVVTRIDNLWRIISEASELDVVSQETVGSLPCPPFCPASWRSCAPQPRPKEGTC